MNAKLTTVVVLMLTTLCLSAQSTNDYVLTPNLAITDGSPVGLTEEFDVSGLSGLIGNVSLSLDVTGGFNGDLYAYLVGPQGQLSILLNRVGVGGSNPIGYGDAGMNITLDGQATENIHAYGATMGYSLNGTVWAADGRNIDPQSSGAAFDSAAVTSGLSMFQNMDPNGTWTFFIADLSGGGGTAALNGITLSIIAVPEPQTWLLMEGGLIMLILLRKRK